MHPILKDRRSLIVYLAAWLTLALMLEQLSATQKSLKRLAEFTAKVTNKSDADKILNPTDKT